MTKTRNENLTIQPIDLEAIEARLRPLSTDKLLLCYYDSYNKASGLFAEAAVAAKLARERGEDVTRLPNIKTMLKIASGQVLPELYMMYMTSPCRNSFEALPLDEQAKLVRDPVVPVVEVGKNGKHDIRMQDMVTAPREVVRLAVGPTGVRSTSEQLEVVGTKKLKQSIKTAANGRASEERQTQPLTIKLTPTEYSHLLRAAADEGVTPQEMARVGLFRAGVIGHRRKGD